MEQNRQARQIGKSEPEAHVNCAEWQHARSQGGDAEPGYNGRSDRCNAPTDKNLDPGHACRVEELRGHNTYAAGLGERGDR